MKNYKPEENKDVGPLCEITFYWGLIMVILIALS